MEVIKNKPSHLTFTKDDLLKGFQRDFLETTEKQEMVSVGELSKEMLSPEGRYLKSLYGRIDYGKTITPESFYVEVITSLEAFMRKMIKRKFIFRVSCPTPRTGHAVYRYDAKDETVDLLWDLPVKKACKFLYRNRLAINPEGSSHVLKTVLEYYDGTLLQKARTLNAEKDDGFTHRIVTDEHLERIREFDAACRRTE